VVAAHAVAVSRATAHPTTVRPPAGRRNALPGPRLLVGRQHRDGITTVGLGLIVQTLHRRPHLLELLPHARTLGRVWPRCAGWPLGSQRIHLHTNRASTLCRSARDGGQFGDLRIGEIQLARLGEEELCRVVHRATARSAHAAWPRHRGRPHLSAWLLRA